MLPDKVVPDVIPLALPIPSVPLFTNLPALPVVLFVKLSAPQLNVPPEFTVNVLGKIVVVAFVNSKLEVAKLVVLPLLTTKSI